jgi:hypothetical protein
MFFTIRAFTGSFKTKIINHTINRVNMRLMKCGFTICQDYLLIAYVEELQNDYVICNTNMFF